MATHSVVGLLNRPETLDLLDLFRREGARHLAVGELLALDVMAYTLDNFWVGQRRNVADIGEIAASRQDPPHDFA